MDVKDEIYAEFLKDLDDADHINLTDWEAEFIESNITRTYFTEKQRAVIDRLKDKYQSKI